MSNKWVTFEVKLKVNIIKESKNQCETHGMFTIFRMLLIGNRFFFF